ncbi:MAG: peptidoglycan DD-metalloendopeptidase family protein, partial [Alphaproteobacteria bacterium]|nr:peptidoglycan DD-metalloendopeptidase family protein [Alphaproteobacteria bacterium]
AAIVERQATVRALEAEIADLDTREAGRLEDLAAERARLARLLGGLQRLALVPAEGMLARPEAPNETVRSALLLRAAVPSIEAEAAELARTVDHLAALRAETAARRDAAEAERRRLAEEVDDLRTLVERRQTFLAQTAERRQEIDDRLTRMAEEAADLEQLIAALEAERRARQQARAAEEAARLAAEEAEREAAERAARIRSETTRPMPDVAVVDGVILPTAGEVVLRYGETDGRGTVSRGIRLRADPGAPIVAPMDGTVRFAGPFRGYGRILILEHGAGYHSTIAGVGRIDAGIGQDVLAGEPIAVTPLPQSSGTQQPDAAAPPAGATAGGAAQTAAGNGGGAMTEGGPEADADRGPAGAAMDAGRPTVYFEFRRNGQPINPIQGLAEAQRRGRG